MVLLSGLGKHDSSNSRISSLNNFLKLYASKYLFKPQHTSNSQMSQKSYYTRTISSIYTSINPNLHKFRIIDKNKKCQPPKTEIKKKNRDKGMTKKSMGKR
jgi:hypothetical protein